MTDKYASYLEYLESPHWRSLRRDAFDRAGNKCEACKTKKDLRGHHLLYRSNLENHTVDEIMALCEPCHDLWHRWLKENGKKVSDFCRQSTRGAITVLLSISATQKPKSKAEKTSKPQHLADEIAARRNQKLAESVIRRSKNEASRKKARMESKNAKTKAKASKKHCAPDYSILQSDKFLELISTCHDPNSFRHQINNLTRGMPFKNKITKRAMLYFKPHSKRVETPVLNGADCPF